MAVGLAQVGHSPDEVQLSRCAGISWAGPRRVETPVENSLVPWPRGLLRLLFAGLVQAQQNSVGFVLAMMEFSVFQSTEKGAVLLDGRFGCTWSGIGDNRLLKLRTFYLWWTEEQVCRPPKGFKPSQVGRTGQNQEPGPIPTSPRPTAWGWCTLEHPRPPRSRCPARSCG